MDLTAGRVIGGNPVGEAPDVLAYDQGFAHLADGAHVVAVDPGTHHSFYPVPAGANGRPALLEREPVG